MDRLENLKYVMKMLLSKATPLNRNILELIWNSKKPIEQAEKSSVWVARIVFISHIVLFLGACYVLPSHKALMYFALAFVFVLDLTIPLAFLIRAIVIKLQKKESLNKEEAIDLYGRIGVFSLLFKTYKEDPILEIVNYIRILLFFSQLWIISACMMIFHLISIKFISGPVITKHIEKMVDQDFTKD
jgi:hypothetical protein